MTDIDLLVGVKIPMRDAVYLGATIYKPPGAARVPAILSITPYNTDTYHERGDYFARQGYAFVIADCRGRGDSEGEYFILEKDAEDGYDAVMWLAEQPWCDGQVAMWGGSYAGSNQWWTAMLDPAPLKTIVPVAATYAPLADSIRGPQRPLSRLAWMVLTSGATAKWNVQFETRFWHAKFRALYLNHLPFSQLDRVALGQPFPGFQTWMSHPPHDPYWDQFAYTPDQWRRLNLPILTITGHYDITRLGALTFSQLHAQYGSPKGYAQHYIIIGPWDHAGTRTPRREVGGWRFGDACLLDLNQLHKEWYDWTLRGGPNPTFLKDKVAYYLMGAEEWKYAASLDQIATTTQRLYLNSVAGRANDVFAAGGLDETPPSASTKPDRYVYDPLDTRPAAVEDEQPKNYITDQRYALNLLGNGLVYHTAPFQRATEVSGFVKLVAWIALDVPDTDFEVILAEILADGTHMRLAEAYLRARYREGVQHETMVPPGEIIRYEFDQFTFFARLVQPGSRLRLTLRCPNSLFRQKNYNGGGAVEHESGADARTAHVTLYHDAERPSYLELPVVA